LPLQSNSNFFNSFFQSNVFLFENVIHPDFLILHNCSSWRLFYSILIHVLDHCILKLYIVRLLPINWWLLLFNSFIRVLNSRMYNWFFPLSCTQCLIWIPISLLFLYLFHFFLLPFFLLYLWTFLHYLT
jgi:hypothetical protein